MAVSALRSRAQMLVEQVKENAHLVGGEWVQARSGQTIDILNPATGELLKRVPRGSGGVIGAPFGGYKNSGFGRTNSADTILEYTQIKAVVFNAGQ